MSAIDERVVSMRFNNAQFESGIKQTLASLIGLKSGLNLDASKKSLDDLSAAGGRFSLANVGASVEGISAKFLAMATVGITALTNIVNKAIAVGTQMVKSLTIDPIKSGLGEYETNLNAIQTILANTQASGATLSDVNATLAELNEYSDQTIYNFSEMAANIGRFTAAGVDLDTSASAIKGIANLAALSGSNSQQAAGAMQQLGQAISAGTVSMEDWNSVTNAGMGGSIFQKRLAETAVAMGTLDKSAVSLDGSMENVTIKGESFRNSISAEKGQSWLTSEVLTSALGQFTGDLTDAELAAEGFTAAQIEAIQTTAKSAKEAATVVKTSSQLMGTLAEAAGSGWAKSWELIFGDFEEAKALWTGVNNVLGGMIGASADARNTMLADWKALGGRTAAIDAVRNAFNALMAVFAPIKEAFRGIFPAVTGDDLNNITVKLRDFTAGLMIGSETAEKIKRVFAGVFSVLHLGVAIIMRIAQVFGAVFSELAQGSGGMLDFAASIGDFLVKITSFEHAGGMVNAFFVRFEALAAGAAAAIREFAGYIAGLFGGGKTASDGAVVEGAIDRVQSRLEPLKGMIDAVTKVWSYLGDMFGKVFTFFTPMALAIGDFFFNLSNTISESLASMDFNQILDMINTGLFAGLILIIKQFLGGGMNIDVGGGMLETIKESFEGLTGTLSAMQAQLKAGTLLKIAAAIGILVVSVIALSMIDSAKLTVALTALTAMFTQLLVAMAIMAKVTASAGFIKMPAAAAAMILLSVAILILVAAVKILSGMEWEELGKGMAGLATMLGLVAGAAKLLSMNSGGLISAGLGMIAVAIAIKILVSAVEDFAAMDWATMARGLAGVAATLLALGLFTKLLDAGKAGIAQSAGLILLAVALKVLASAVGDFAEFNWEELGKGMAAMAVALLIIAGAMKLIPPTIVVTAAGLILFAAALLIIAEVLGTMAEMTWEEIARGMVVLAGSLVIIAGAMYLMTAALPGALALIVVAGALTLMVPVLQALGAMTWETILTGLGALAAMFLVLGIAGLVLTPVVPTLLGLGAAIILIGAGVALAGVGIMALSVGLTALSVSGGAAALGLTALVSAVINLIPMALVALANGIVAFATVIGNAAPTFLVAMVQLITALLTAIGQVAPLIIDTLINLITMLLNALLINVPKFLVMGLKLIKALLDGIANNIGGIVASALSIITNLINGIAAGIPGLIQAGANLILTFITSLTTAINANSAAMGKAGGDLAVAIVKGMVNGITAGLTSVVTAAKNLAKSALDSAKSFLGIKSPSREFAKIGVFSGEGLSGGLIATAKMVGKAAEHVADTALSTLKKSMSNVASVMSDDMDMTPVIRPVLDLSDIQKGSNLIDGMLAAANINPGVSYNGAAAISANNRAAMVASDAPTNAPASSVTFVQNNSSPKALSEAEIYRQTRNQLSVAKGVLIK